MARVLIIDDELLVRITLRGMLESVGHEVIEAANGEEGIKSYTESPSDVIITDLIMPEQDGFTTILQLRDHDPDVKIIAISGGVRMDGSDFLTYAERLGARHVLTKPFDRGHLLKAVDESLQSPS